MHKEYRFYNYEQSFAYYAEQIMNMRQAKINGEVILAKPVLLLTIIDSIEGEVFHNNLFRLTDWFEKRYEALMKKYVKSSQFPNITEIYNPFWHLSSDGFWHLNLKEKPQERVTPSKKWLKENVEYACLDDDFWVLLQSKDWREKLRDFIIENKLK